MAIVKFNESSNGNLSATVQKILVNNFGQKCTLCRGKFQNKPLVGVAIVSNLKFAGNNKYNDGFILDPKTGKTYSFDAELSPDGKQLTGRGYVGISALGRTQTWYRVN